MTTGQRIRMLRKERNLTQKQLAERIGVSTSAVGQFETTKEPQRIETLEKIASVLEVPLLYLIGEISKVPADMALDQKLRHVGYSVGFDEENAAMWINYPDGYLEVTQEDLDALNNSANDFLLFQLNQLRGTHASDFRPVYKKAVNRQNRKNGSSVDPNGDGDSDGDD